MELSLIPSEVIYEILPNMNISTIVNFLSINKSFHYLYQDEVLWQQLVKRDFNQINKLYDTWLMTYKICHQLFKYMKILINKYSPIRPEYRNDNIMANEMVKVATKFIILFMNRDTDKGHNLRDYYSDQCEETDLAMSKIVLGLMDNYISDWHNNEGKLYERDMMENFIEDGIIIRKILSKISLKLSDPRISFCDIYED